MSTFGWPWALTNNTFFVESLTESSTLTYEYCDNFTLCRLNESLQKAPMKCVQWSYFG